MRTEDYEDWYSEREDEIREDLATGEADLVLGRLIYESDTEGEQ